MNLSGRHYGIILSNLATAFLHLSLYPVLGLDPIFLNGFGYLGLLAAYFLPVPLFQQRHRLVWWVMVGYTVLTIILWAIMGDKNFVAGTSSAIGYYAKAAEVVLLAFLWADRPMTKK
jgi:hypothetical protein